ncbi:MAG: tagatose-bisphosphate aldolase [Pseudorhodobacter sp.]
MSTSERRGYQQICNADGAMMVIACDQRGGMRAVLADTPQEREAISNAVLGETKADITKYLASEAGCVLVDPICAVPGLVDNGDIARDTALLIGLDASGWDTSPGGYRISKMVDGVTARQVRKLGGTGGKIMVYLRMDTPEANEENLRTLRDSIEDFTREDVLLVVEFLTYQLEGESDEDYAARLPDLIVEGSRACLALGAKVLKIPFPGSEEACARVTEISGNVPWAVLSAGVDHETFLGQVEIAMRNGASGVIAGRSLWKDCISLDRAVTKTKLTEVAIPRLHDIQAIIRKYSLTTSF